MPGNEEKTTASPGACPSDQISLASNDTHMKTPPSLKFKAERDKGNNQEVSTYRMSGNWRGASSHFICKPVFKVGIIMVTNVCKRKLMMQSCLPALSQAGILLHGSRIEIITGIKVTLSCWESIYSGLARGGDRWGTALAWAIINGILQRYRALEELETRFCFLAVLDHPRIHNR